jgi:hypothetical protein
MSERKTVQGAYDKIEAHEDLCAERYKNIHESISDLKDGVKWVIRLGVVTMLSLIGYLGSQVLGA